VSPGSETIALPLHQRDGCPAIWSPPGSRAVGQVGITAHIIQQRGKQKLLLF